MSKFITRMYSSNSPEALTRWDVIPTLLVSWWCTGFSLAIIFVRVLGRYIRAQVLFPEDWVMLISVIPLLTRMSLVHLVLIYGTNNIVSTDLSDIQIRQREIGSGLVLAARIFYTLFIWNAKFTITEFLARLTTPTWRRSFQLMLNFIRLFLAVTFFAVVMSTLLECQPFHHFWKVNPAPAPKCRQGYAHLVAMGACDAITDIMLVAFPIPIITVSKMPTRRKFSLTVLFALSLVLVAMACYRVPAVIQRGGNQQYRSLFASIEILVATVVSNVIVIGSFMRDRGMKKQKYKIGAVRGARDHKVPCQATITYHQWGSDADLATDVGICRDPERKKPTYQEIRPALVAHTTIENPEKNSLTESEQAPYHMRLQHDEEQVADRVSQKYSPHRHVSNSPECIASDTISDISCKKSPEVCLNDVGGLLARRQSSATTASTCVAHECTFIPVREARIQQPRPSRQSHNFLEAAINVLSTSPRSSGSGTSYRLSTLRNSLRTMGTSSSDLRDQPLESGPRPACGDEDRTDTSAVEQRPLQLNGLENLNKTLPE
ncbi:hypothetical protein AJ78_01058 [Emergomyces pasteurianus Ep9510]|uniref:Rhodopsin domain-containing protein n=1 Tax=Emergomyces pasteurianus Ep9510 TaxID=1447872 RepID=A0A1J9PSR2_9EURO|nr:hypothetical protein AJ78_01058 [Emergomyces pasteurianus Ep9510]